jgi:hypothetical protein
MLQGPVFGAEAHLLPHWLPGNWSVSRFFSCISSTYSDAHLLTNQLSGNKSATTFVRSPGPRYESGPGATSLISPVERGARCFENTSKDGRQASRLYSIRSGQSRGPFLLPEPARQAALLSRRCALAHLPAPWSLVGVSDVPLRFRRRRSRKKPNDLSKDSLSCDQRPVGAPPVGPMRSCFVGRRRGSVRLWRQTRRPTVPSTPVLGARGGEIPPRDSPIAVILQ